MFLQEMNKEEQEDKVSVFSGAGPVALSISRRRPENAALAIFSGIREEINASSRVPRRDGVR